jgi:hypothetical protein
MRLTDMDHKDHFPVSSTDELSVDGAAVGRSRKLGELKATNSPLSAADLERRRGDPRKESKPDWAPRTTENIDELVPIPEDQPAKQ